MLASLWLLWCALWRLWGFVWGFVGGFIVWVVCLLGRAVLGVCRAFETVWDGVQNGDDLGQMGTEGRREKGAGRRGDGRRAKQKTAIFKNDFTVYKKL